MNKKEESDKTTEKDEIKIEEGKKTENDGDNDGRGGNMNVESTNVRCYCCCCCNIMSRAKHGFMSCS